MSRPIRASIPHALGKDEARRRIEAGATKTTQQMFAGLPSVVSFRSQWDGDRLAFEGGMLGQRMTGRLEVQADAVLIEVDVPGMLAALADRIRGMVTGEAKRLLEKK